MSLGFKDELNLKMIEIRQQFKQRTTTTTITITTITTTTTF